MRKTIILGILIFSSFFYMIYFMLSALDYLPFNIQIIFPLHMFFVAISGGLFIYLLRDMWRRNLSYDQKTFWLIAFFLGSILTVIIYWLIYFVYKREKL